jgi:hypothetical protein
MCANYSDSYLFSSYLCSFYLFYIDALVKSGKFTCNVIPAKAGIQKYQGVKIYWTPAFAGVTTFNESVILIF